MMIDFKKDIRVLIVDDNPGDRALMVEYVEEAGVPFKVSEARSLAEALEKLNWENIDVVLLDLGLPDSQGLDTFYRVHAAVPHVPIVVITGVEDEEMALEAIRNEAQDYLIKGKVTGELLVRSIRYAIERQRLAQQIVQERERREKEAFRGLSISTEVAARIYGEKPLSESVPELFQEFVKEYGRLLRVSLEKQAKKIPVDPSVELKDFADRLGQLGATPRDVVEIHKAALEAATETELPAKARALITEGRFLVLELMGYLVSFYRRNCVRYGKTNN